MSQRVGPLDLLVARLWEESTPRASEGTLAPTVRSTLKPMPVDAQSASTARRTCWRQLGRPSPDISIASEAESEILISGLLKYLVNGASSPCTGSVWIRVGDEGLRQGGPPLTSFLRGWAEQRSLCLRALYRIHLSFTFSGSRTEVFAIFAVSSTKARPLMGGWGKLPSNQRFSSPPLSSTVIFPQKPPQKAHDLCWAFTE